ncbi:hypothetical protein BDZ90DRAFT_281744 [Jaminaea rosea]|uniref:Chaplin domain-containing protein n=1 Tax=Jaminaea rosea TaxID=1569628 RepID=A0A316UIJ1_9BASI|nr:hypothetical protein BDZ90DRAFT_281744 [Jaminaea rosea]PWN25147.1 hypothetical protein BDZ90DRAFT_281744 [Jaminaea rosea]
MKTHSATLLFLLMLGAAMCAAAAESGLERRIDPPTPAPGIGDAGGVACVRLTRACAHSSACADLVLLPPPLHHSPHVTGLPGAVSSGQPDSDTESGNEKTGASSKTGGHRSSASPTTSAGSTSSTGSGNTTDPLGSIISQGASVAGVIGTAVGNVAGNVSTFVGGLPTYTSGTPSPTATNSNGSNAAGHLLAGPQLAATASAFSVCILAGLVTTLL